VPHRRVRRVRVASGLASARDNFSRKVHPVRDRGCSLPPMRVRVQATLLLIGLVLAASPASAAPDDRAATAAYVRADAALVTTAHARLGAAETALQSLLARVRRECPNVVAGSPQNEASEKLTAQLIGTMRLVALRPLAAATATYARAVSALRWSSATLTRTVRTYARELLAQSRLAPADFCGVLRAWKTSGYATLPPDTLRFDSAYYAVDVAVGLLPVRQLAPSLAGSQRATVAHTRTLEERIVEFEAQAVETWAKIMNAAGLQP
jgi:hypothetical protein